MNFQAIAHDIADDHGFLAAVALALCRFQKQEVSHES